METSVGVDTGARRRPRLMPYAVLIVLVLAINAAIFAWGAVAGWWVPTHRVCR